MLDKPAPPNLGEVSADTGDDVGAGFVTELRASRDEVLNTHGKGDLELYERLLRDDQVFPTFSQRRASVIARETKVDPGGPSDLDRLAAEHLRTQLDRVSWDRTCYRMLAGLMYGRGHAECMFQVGEGERIELAAIKVRRARRFAFGSDGSLRLMRNDKPEVMPARKFWTFTCGADDDDDVYGRGLGHWLYWPVWFKRNALRFWAIFLERFAMGTPKAVIPPGSKEEERNKLLAMLESITTGGKIIVPRGVDVDIIAAARDSGGDYSRFMDRMDAAIAKVVLTQTMTTDDGSSRAQGEVHERVMNATVKSDSDLLTESFVLGPATWLTEWNFPGAKVPRVYRDFTVAKDLAAQATRDGVLNGMGFRPTAAYVRDTYGDGFEDIGPPAAAAPAADATAGAAFAERLTRAIRRRRELMFGEPPRDATPAVEDLLADDGWRRAIGPEVERIEALLEDAESLEEVRDRLGELALADPDKLVDGLARVMFAARAQGEVGAERTDDEGAV